LCSLSSTDAVASKRHASGSSSVVATHEVLMAEDFEHLANSCPSLIHENRILKLGALDTEAAE
jgi:hypothetical protein